MTGVTGSFGTTTEIASLEPLETLTTEVVTTPVDIVTSAKPNELSGISTGHGMYYTSSVTKHHINFPMQSISNQF